MPPRPPKPITEAYLERAALHYLQRYAASSAHLRKVLARKVERSCRHHETDPSDCQPMLEAVVGRMIRTGLVDDRTYAQARVASLRGRGGSARMIAAKLGAKGVDRSLIEAALGHEEGTDDAAAAAIFARRRRLGPWRTKERAERRERDLAAMARQGFPFAVARAVIDGKAED